MKSGYLSMTLWMRLTSLTVIVSPVLIVSAIGSANLGGSDTVTDFDSDKRLDRRVSVNQTGLPLKAVLGLMSDKSLALYAGRSCAEMKLQIRVEDRPLRSILQALAELVPGTWREHDTAGAYTLEMNSSERARRERWWALFLSERERAMEVLKEAVRNQLRAQPLRRKPTDPDPENSDRALEEKMATEQEFFLSLTSEIQDQIASKLTETPFFRTIIGFSSDDDESALIVPMKSLSHFARNSVLDRAMKITGKSAAALEADSGVVSFVNGGSVVAASASFPGGDAGTVFVRQINLPMEARALSLEHGSLPQLVGQLQDQASPALRELAAFQATRVWRNDTNPQFRTTRIPPWRRQDLLKRLATQGQIQYVADYYSRAGSAMPAAEYARPINGSIKQELDSAAMEHDLSWKKHADDVYLLRNNRWYRDDYLEVPEALVREWLQLEWFSLNVHEQKNAPPYVRSQIRNQLDWEAQVVRRLSRWQIGNGMKWAAREDIDESKSGDLKSAMLGPYPLARFPFFTDSDRLMKQYLTVSFYSQLRTSQRAEILGGRMRLSSLDAKQRLLAASLLPSLTALSGSWDARIGLRAQTNGRVPVPNARYRVRLYVAGNTD